MRLFSFADLGSAMMDPKERVSLKLIRVKTGDGATGYNGKDKLSAWGYQGSCTFTADNLKHLASMEGMAVWFDKFAETESKSPRPWGEYQEVSEKFLKGEFGKPPLSNKDAIHLCNAPRSYYAIAKECFDRGIFVSPDSWTAFSLHSPPSKEP